MTRSGCGRRWSPPSRPARRCPRTAACTGRGCGGLPAQPEFLAELGVALQRLPRPVRLILDDVHELVDPDALHGLQIFMRNRPAGVQLVLSSRLDPPLSLPRLRLAGRLWELRAAQMRFSPAEAATLLARSGVRAHRGAGRGAAPAYRRVGGGPATGRAGGGRDRRPGGFLAQFSGDERSVADYLVEEIISGLPAGPRGSSCG